MIVCSCTVVRLSLLCSGSPLYVLAAFSTSRSELMSKLTWIMYIIRDIRAEMISIPFSCFPRRVVYTQVCFHVHSPLGAETARRHFNGASTPRQRKCEAKTAYCVMRYNSSGLVLRDIGRLCFVTEPQVRERVKRAGKGQNLLSRVSVDLRPCPLDRLRTFSPVTTRHSNLVPPAARL